MTLVILYDACHDGVSIAKKVYKTSHAFPVTANAKIGEKTNGQCLITTPKN